MMGKPSKCSFVKTNGNRCGCMALSGSDTCRWHKVDNSQTIGHIDQSLIDAEPGTKLEFWDDYSTSEIANYVNNATGGRVQIPLHLSHERMAAQAVEVLS